MTRDDSTGGWVPMGGGGLSNVSVRKKITSTSSVDDASIKPEYLICGKRISDQTMVLSCTIKKDFQYNKVMPTFHHWRTGNKKFGLTFQTAADARAFDKGVRNAVEDLLDGAGCLNNFHGSDIGDDDVFMTLELPVDSRSSSGSSSESGNGISAYRPASASPSAPGDTHSATSSPYAHPNQHHLHRMHFMRPSRTMPGVSSNGSGTSGLSASVSAGPVELQRLQAENVWIKERIDPKEQQPSVIDHDKIEPLSPGEPYSYVHFARGRSSRNDHEYCYPAIETIRASQPEGSSGVKKPLQMSPVISEPPLLPSKKKRSSKKQARCISPSGRMHCRHCLDTFNEEDNPPGSCEYAPDGMLACINAATCISCAQCMLYHCMSDTEGDFNHHPCSCDASDDHCRRRWTGLALLSLFVPCLWCYLPLRACHRCGVNCGIWGGKHEPS